MHRPSPERIYGLRELTRILSLTPKRVAQLRRLDLLRLYSGYTFRDLLALRAASALLDAGASVRQIRDALTAIRKQDPGIRNPLTEVRLIVDGGLLLAQSDRVRFDALPIFAGHGPRASAPASGRTGGSLVRAGQR